MTNDVEQLNEFDMVTCRSTRDNEDVTCHGWETTDEAAELYEESGDLSQIDHTHRTGLEGDLVVTDELIFTQHGEEWELTGEGITRVKVDRVDNLEEVVTEDTAFKRGDVLFYDDSLAIPPGVDFHCEKDDNKDEVRCEIEP